MEQNRNQTFCSISKECFPVNKYGPFLCVWKQTLQSLRNDWTVKTIPTNFTKYYKKLRIYLLQKSIQHYNIIDKMLNFIQVISGVWIKAYNCIWTLPNFPYFIPYPWSQAVFSSIEYPFFLCKLVGNWKLDTIFIYWYKYNFREVWLLFPCHETHVENQILR